MTKAEAHALGITHSFLVGTRLERIAVPDGRSKVRQRYFWLTPTGRRLGPHNSEAAALRWLAVGLKIRAGIAEENPQ